MNNARRALLSIAPILFGSIAFGQPRLILSVSASTPVAKVGAPYTLNVSLSGSNGLNISGVQFAVDTIPAIPTSIWSVFQVGAVVQGIKQIDCGLNMQPVPCIVIGTNNATPMQDGIIATITTPAWPLVSGNYSVNLVTTAATNSNGDLITLTPTPTFPITVSNPCDLNGDGKLDTLDIRNATDQVEKVIPCTSGDLDGDGVCTVADIQRVVNAVASASGSCRVGK